MGKVYGRTVTDFAAEALALALSDAGLERSDLDGLLINANHSPEMAPALQFSLGLQDLSLQCAAYAIADGQASAVACVYADAPLADGKRASQSAYNGKRTVAGGLAGLRVAYGDYGPANSMYALALRRHMHLYGTTHDQLGTIAVGQRQWAGMNPRAQMREPITLEDYH